MTKKTVFLILLTAIAVLIIGGGSYIYTKNEKMGEVATTSAQATSTAQADNWKTYTSSEYRFQFQYPSYLGEVEVTPTNIENDCYRGKYTRYGVIVPNSAYISFSNEPTIGSGGKSGKSYVSYHIGIVQENTSTDNTCEIDLISLKSNFASDSRYESTDFKQKNSIITYKSTIGTTIGTSANRFYTLFNQVGDTITIVQPIMSFTPLAYTDESAEILGVPKDEAVAGSDSIVEFIESNPKAEEIRNHLNDLEQIVQTFKFTNDQVLE